ncbi:hypothetical protein B0H19DRAFT_1146545 [Mycena capillaripes]|nr:hypothetical protein B0H19DRAFT_1146545 [Mycena capillaripes]
MPSLAKSASLVITLAGGLINSFLTLQLAGSWNTLRALDAESELDAWKLDGLRVLWMLLAVYLLAGAFVSFVGFFGVLRNKATHVRLYRDCSSADLAFTVFLTLLSFLAATQGRASARAACEQPELAPLLAFLFAFLSGSVSPAPDEACERSLEHAALVALAGLLALTVVRLHFLLAVGTHYAALCRASNTDCESGGSPQRIRLLPLPRGVAPADVVYAPVHCPAAAESLLGANAEVWVRSSPAAGMEATAYAPAYVSQPPSPATPAYAPAYVTAAVPTAAGPTAINELEVELDAGLLDARVVRTKREWI